METDTHPPLERLTAYLEHPQAAEHAELRRHLAGCAHCRRQVSELSRITGSLEQLLPTTRDNRHDIPEAAIAELVERGIDARERLQEDPRALKAALHYATHSAAMRAHLEREAGPATGTGISPPAQSSPWRRLLDWRPPALLTVPLAAAAALAVAVNLLPLLGHTPAGGQFVASFQDRAVLQMQAPEMPGMGFFHDAGTREIPFDGLRMQYRDGAGLRADWQAVDAAKSYTLRLLQVAGPDRPLAETRGPDTHAEFPGLVLEAGRRYRWTLSGETADGQSFRAEGGFALSTESGR